MRFGIAVYENGPLSPKELSRRLDGIEGLGTRHAELRFGDLPLILAEGRFPRNELRMLGDILASYSLTYSAHAAIVQDGFRLNLAHPAKAVRRRTREFLGEYLRACDMLGIIHLVTHLGKVRPRDMEGELTELDGAFEARRAVSKLAEDASIPLVIENSNVDPVQIALFERPDEVADDSFPVCLDIGHGWLAAQHHGFPPESFAGLLGERVVQVHIHDNQGQVHPEGSIVPADGLGDLHLPLGEGSCPAERFLSGLAGYRGIFVIEHADFDHPAFEITISRLTDLLGG